MEHDERADRLEQEADKLAEEGVRVGSNIDETEADWKAKEQDASVPGAQPDVDEESQGAPAVEAEETAGTAGDEEPATGNPDAAGDSDPEESE